MKKFALSLVGLAIVGIGFFFIFSKNGTEKIKTTTKTTEVQNANAVLTADFNTSVCDQIPKSVVEQSLKKTITEVKPSSVRITNFCDYYTNQENHIKIGLSKLNFENQKSGQSSMEEVAIETDPSIKAEHFIVIPIQQPSIVNIIVKIDDSLILTVENGLSTEYGKKQVVAVASNAVNYLKSN